MTRPLNPGRPMSHGDLAHTYVEEGPRSPKTQGRYARALVSQRSAICELRRPWWHRALFAALVALERAFGGKRGR